MINNDKLRVSNIVSKIDTTLAAYYQEQGRNDYYQQVDDIKVGKFAKYCADKHYDSDAIENEFGCNEDIDNIENCEIIEFDNNMPIHPKTPKTDIDREKFRVLKLIYNISNSTHSTPYKTPFQQLYTPTTTFNSCFVDNENKEEDNFLLKRTCRAIGEWYQKMGNNNYYDMDGHGLFSKWFYVEGMEINEMYDEFEELENCLYLVFDMDKDTHINYFPFPANDNTEEMQFKIMSYCFKNGTAPDIHINPFDDSIDYIIDDEWIKQTEDIYETLCPKLYSVITNQEQNLIRLFAVGYKYNICLVQLLTDIFMRDRLTYFLKNNKKMLTVYAWSFDNIYIKYLVNKYGISIRNVISCAIQSYIKRIVPVFRLDPMYKIKDDIYGIAMHFKAATEFVQTVLVDGVCNAPYQWDFCIAIRECEKTEIVIKPEVCDCDELKLELDEEIEFECYKYSDILGDIVGKLEKNNCKFLQQEFNPNKYNDNKLMSFARCYMDSYNQFLNKYDIKKANFPRGSRFCTLIDRRKLITKYIKNKYVERDRNKNGNKMDDILFWIPPNISGSNNYNDGIKEVYFDTLSQCLIPNYNYNKSNKKYNNYSDDTNQQNVKYKHLRQTITSSSKCNGGLLIFTFQVDAEDEIAVYLCWEGQFIRFLPQDILQILPQIFVSSRKNIAFVQQSKKNKNNNIVNKIQYCHRKFDNWYNKIARK